MNIVVTGGAGAVGTYLCERLLQEGNKVLCLDNLLTSKEENILHLRDDPNFYFRNVDVSKERDVRDYVADADLVYHLAGSVGVMLVDRDPMGCLDNNLRTGQAVFKVAAQYGIKVVYTSSSEVYGNGWGKPFSETDILQVGSPDKMRWSYASSKLTQEFLCKGYSDKNVVVRLFNIVSPLHKKSYVVPSFTSKVQNEEEITVYGDGSATRCFCDVKDAVEYLYGLGLDDRANGETYNIGNSQNQFSMKELAEEVIKFYDKGRIVNKEYSEVFSGQHDDIDMRVPDTSKIRKLTGYKPKYGLTDILGMFDEREDINYSSAS